MDYLVLPNFLRQREQRIGGLFTPVQMFAGVSSLLPLVAAAQISVWLLVPITALVVVIVWSLGPVEGGFRYERWLFPLRVSLLRQKIRDHHAFVELGTTSLTTLPLVWRRRGELSLAARIEAPKMKK